MSRTGPRTWTIASICFLGMFAGGCATNESLVQVYAGPERPSSETVFLACDHKTFITDVYGPAIRTIWDSEDKVIWEGNSRAFRLMPGVISFEIYYDNGNGCPSGAIAGAAAGFAHMMAAERTTSVIKTNFDAGREYIVRYKRTGLFAWQWQVSYWIEDLQNGELIYGVRPEDKKDTK
jgi:hypothetical protein